MSGLTTAYIAQAHPELLLKYSETQAGHGWSNWRNVLEDALVYFFGE